MDSYNIQQANYSQYQKDLAAWRRSEDERRKQLSQQRRDLEGISVATKANMDAIENKKKDTSEVTALRNQISLWKSERDSFRNVLEAAKSGNPHQALRPRSLTPLLITDEKNLLLKQLTEIQ
jgi:multidrug resistance efflux pump